MIMRNMGGKETFIALKAFNPGIRVLLASGYSVEDQAREVIALGANGFIQKPYRLAELAVKMRDIMGTP
jgi:two-component system cell cycle sensor histidine kinase/response regulator CckA